MVKNGGSAAMAMLRSASTSVQHNSQKYLSPVVSRFFIKDLFWRPYLFEPVSLSILDVNEFKHAESDRPNGLSSTASESSENDSVRVDTFSQCRHLVPYRSKPWKRELTGTVTVSAKVTLAAGMAESTTADTTAASAALAVSRSRGGGREAKTSSAGRLRGTGIASVHAASPLSIVGSACTDPSISLLSAVVAGNSLASITLHASSSTSMQSFSTANGCCCYTREGEKSQMGIFLGA
jgi:hypothetical protein